MYPVAPSSLKAKWDKGEQYESFFLSQNYQGGVDERGNRNQLNQTNAAQTLSLTIDNQFEYLEINEFLTENLGRPFYFDSVLYRCETFKFTYLSAVVFELELSLTQVFRP
jgi:hypothetical protein